jgi:hypothetical protein
MSHPSRRHILRGETARAHTALEAVVGPIDSLPSYVRYLRGMGMRSVRPSRRRWAR